MLSRSRGMLLRLLVVLLGVCFLIAVPRPAIAEEGFVQGNSHGRHVQVVANQEKNGTPAPQTLSPSEPDKNKPLIAGSHLMLKPVVKPAAPAPLPVLNSPARMAHAFVPECWDGALEVEACIADPAAPVDPAAPAPPPPSRADVEGVVRSLVSRLALPDVTPMVGPDPSVNEWKMAVVGHPLWLWTDAPGHLSTSVSGYGITIRMDAVRAAITYDMGEGSTVRCVTTSPYTSRVKPGTPSPTCGYTYQRASLPKGVYTVTATARWNVNWSALGFTGTIPVSYSDSRTLPVGELQAVVVHR